MIKREKKEKEIKKKKEEKCSAVTYKYTHIFYLEYL
jgi:hypothetical protein